MAITGVPPAAFMRSGDPSDPRAQRTRTLLITEFERQLTTDGAPSVASVTRRAGVSRSTFYLHFSSIEELGTAAVRSALDELGRDPEPLHASARGSRISYEAFFTHIRTHHALYHSALANDLDSPAGAELREALVRQTETIVADLDGRPEGTTPRAAAVFVIGGVLALVAEWLRDPEPGDPQELGAAVMALMPDWITDGRPPSVEVHPHATP